MKTRRTKCIRFDVTRGVNVDLGLLHVSKCQHSITASRKSIEIYTSAKAREELTNAYIGILLKSLVFENQSFSRVMTNAPEMILIKVRQYSRQ